MKIVQIRKVIIVTLVAENDGWENFMSDVLTGISVEGSVPTAQ
jgi:hypothetical protein